ncbi:pimeloyl-ACP methyl ester carboxylesterase [Actinocorallia herbida]|uniref:Pimeloyl-ACP methyl ester carboxylesterase n=1 Tax=Actinocorallia herbida TaxID=58109 RepID=A0A3N1DA22_9ACTN|nr:alpha/beta hydrolase [Actinocorallia herbida]ROO90346.1 pimeloyl-ACP methyl ester carboxylesterase [Actinocorallia herbida]
MSRRTLMWAAAALGAATAGAGVAGAAAQRHAARRLALRPDPYAGEPLGGRRGAPVRVTADDGTVLHAEIDNPDRDDVAIVFCHGWTLTGDSWHFQREALQDAGRVVVWDQRGHGRSESAAHGTYGLPQLGHDLRAVIDATVPEHTPVVLVGHSMGGMTIMRFADAYPELIGSRIKGAALVCTSSGGLGEVTLGLPAVLARVSRRVLPAGLRAATPRVLPFEGLRKRGRTASLIVEDLLAFGPDASPTAVRFAEEMMAATRLDALTGFLHSMLTTSEISPCTPLADIETLIVAAENDRLTPVEHSLTIATKCPKARLEVIPTAGHMAMLERPTPLSDNLQDLLTRI